MCSTPRRRGEGRAEPRGGLLARLGAPVGHWHGDNRPPRDAHVYVLTPHSTSVEFPPPEHASPEGLLAIGGDLAAGRLIEAYRHGIFPWYSTGQPILWWSPDPRTVLYPEHLRVTRSLRKRIRSHRFRITIDTCFEAVLAGCAAPRRNHVEGGTWITAQMRNAYIRLHALGHAHSVETWHEQRLVGGLYGVALGRVFFGESMFSFDTDASKVALAWLVAQLRRWGFSLIDCQLPSQHVFTLGAMEIPRSRFLAELAEARDAPGVPAPWRFDPDLEPAP